MTYLEIIDVLKLHIESVDKFVYGGYDKTELEVLVGDFNEIERYGGKDKGSEWYRIIYFRQHGIYIRIEGYYSSYYGTEFDDGWDCCREVRPIEKTITVYE